MINKIRLKDFQSHKDSTFEFIPGVNVITGVSGVGKSSVIRALNYIFTNKKPNGVEYKRRPDAKGFEIEIDVDGHKIKRVKSAKANEYYIDGEAYKDIGVTVPEDVSKITNIRSIKVGQDEFNVQLAKQFDPHFLMFLPDSSKVKFLNRLSGSHILDIALKETNKDLVAVEKDKLNNENELTQVQSSINYLVELIDPIKLVVADARIKYEQLTEDVKRLDALKLAKKHLDDWKRQKLEFDSIKFILSQVNIEGFEKSLIRLNDLRKLYWEYKDISDKIKGLEESIRSIESINVVELESKSVRLDNLRKVCYDYSSLNNEMGVTENKIKTTDNRIAEQIKQVKDFLESNPVCPTCNSKITKSKIDKIIKELEQ